MHSYFKRIKRFVMLNKISINFVLIKYANLEPKYANLEPGHITLWDLSTFESMGPLVTSRRSAFH